MGRRSNTTLIVVLNSVVLISLLQLLQRYSLHSYLQPLSSFAAPSQSSVKPSSINHARTPLQIDEICPPSTEINSQNVESPPSQLIHPRKLREGVKSWYGRNCPRKEKSPYCRFDSIARHLLQLAVGRNETLLTVQVGAMDGKTNDPMYNMFVKTSVRDQVDQTLVNWLSSSPTRIRYSHENKIQSLHDRTLVHWLPVLIEPVPINYEDMIKTYSDIAKDNGLGCAVPIHAAASYNATKTECAFCRIDTAEDAPQTCRDLPSWARLQLGTLECDYSRHYFRSKFDLCVLQDPLPCSSVGNLLRGKGVPPEQIAMLQVDIEGYEHILLEGFLKEIPDESLPPIIHFEHKVMRERDKNNYLGVSSRMDALYDMMTARGYALLDQGEDYLAVRTLLL